MTTPEGDRIKGDRQEDSNDNPKLRSCEPLQLFFLLRLSRFATLRREANIPNSQEDILIKLLNKALYSTYRDCVALGVDFDASTLLPKDRRLPQIASQNKE